MTPLNPQFTVVCSTGKISDTKIINDQGQIIGGITLLNIEINPEKIYVTAKIELMNLKLDLKIDKDQVTVVEAKKEKLE